MNAEDRRRQRELDRSKPRRVFEGLLRVLDRGRDHLRIWSDLRDLVHKDPNMADLAPSFFLLSGIAHLEAATLAAAKLNDTHEDSVSISYLLNLIEQNKAKKAFRDDWPKASAVLTAARSSLAEVNSIISQIKQRRDTHIAHLERRDIGLSFDEEAVEVGDLLRIFEVVDGVCRNLSVHFTALRDATRFSMEDLHPDGLSHLMHFARAGFESDAVQSPSATVERIRAWDRSLREARLELDEVRKRGRSREPAG